MLAGIAVDGGNGICNGTCQEVPIALAKRQGRVAALDEEIEGWLYVHFLLILNNVQYIMDINHIVCQELWCVLENWRWAWLLLGWVTVYRQVNHVVCVHPPSSTQLSTVCGMVKWVSALGWVIINGECSLPACYRRASDSSQLAWSKGQHSAATSASFYIHRVNSDRLLEFT